MGCVVWCEDADAGITKVFRGLINIALWGWVCPAAQRS
jgi:hypothetical protein